MCGLIYHKSFKGQPVNRAVLEQYDKQKYRGREGFGVFDMEHKKMARDPSENHILKWLKTVPSNEILFHHRMPTSTANVKNACHPFSTYDYFGDNQYILIHNGIISNPLALYEAHSKLGIDYSSMQPDLDFNDSEALLWDIALYLEGKQDKLNVEGSIAFICIKQSPDGNKLYFGRNDGNPLNMHQSKKRLTLSSTGIGEPITTDTLYEFDYETHLVTQSTLTIPDGWNFKSYGGSNYTPASYTAGGTTTKPDDGFDWGAVGYTYDYTTKTWRYTGTDNDPWNGEKYDDGYEYTGEPGKPLKSLPSDNSLSTLSQEIQDRVKEFMELSNGYYRLAYEMLGEKLDALETLEREATLSISEGFEKEILIGARSVLWFDPLWIDQNDEVQNEYYSSTAPQLNLLEAGA